MILDSRDRSTGSCRTARPAAHVLGFEGHAEVVVEVRAERRIEGDAPAHALAQCRRAPACVARATATQTRRDSSRCGSRPSMMIDAERAAHALQRLAGSLHDVLHEELRAAAEQVRERHAAVRRIELVVLVDLDPGQGAALFGQRVAAAGEFLFLLHQLLAFGDPLFPGHDAMHDGSFSDVILFPCDYWSNGRTAIRHSDAGDRGCRSRPSGPAGPWP